jgi:hypothetical protein
MPDYRVYCLDGAGRIGFADWIEADDDDDAVRKARILRPDLHICEVWEQQRLVAKLNASGHVNRRIIES